MEYSAGGQEKAENLKDRSVATEGKTSFGLSEGDGINQIVTKIGYTSRRGSWSCEVGRLAWSGVGRTSVTF